MKKLLGIVVLGLLLSVNAYASNEGSGPIEFPPKFEKRFKDYLGHVANKNSINLLSHSTQMEQTIGKQSQVDPAHLKLLKKKQLKHVIKKQKKRDVRFLQEVKRLFGIQILSQVLYTH